MKPLIECVPNFSDSDPARVDALAAAMSGVPGAFVLDVHSDADHNRCVITLAGEPEAVAEAALRGVGRAAETIDLRRHRGVHPRIGATDVLPFVPLEGVGMDECVALARRVGAEIWRRHRIPVYFYEAAALRGSRVNLEDVRRRQFEGLSKEVASDGERAPDIGDAALHPSAGAIAVGARKILIACNFALKADSNSTDNVAAAREIARTIRAANGGLPCVKALGMELKRRGVAQVSVNLTDFERTPLRLVFETVSREAKLRGCSVAEMEIVGLVPRKALQGMPAEAPPVDETHILENRLAAALNAGSKERILWKGAARRTA